MKKIVCIIGTRPQLIKHSVLLKHLKSSFIVETVNTQQHYSYQLNDLLQKDLFTNEVFHCLNLNENYQPAERLGEMVLKIAAFLQESKPDAVLVYGDTDSTLAGALAAKKSNHLLIHVEAGERSGNIEMPEEYNRIITDNLSDVLFCSSLSAWELLLKENRSKSILYSGDIMKDLVYQKASTLKQPLLQDNYIYCTIHRNYNQKNPQKLFDLITELGSLNTTVIFPIHPATFNSLTNFGLHFNHFSNIQFVSPLSYSESIHYIKFAEAVVTDSGGIQKEAYWLKRPCITIRKETEWTDTLKGNWNRLLYDNFSMVHTLLVNGPNEEAYDQSLYGSGNAGAIIQKNLFSLLN